MMVRNATSSCWVKLSPPHTIYSYQLKDPALYDLFTLLSPGYRFPNMDPLTSAPLPLTSHVYCLRLPLVYLHFYMRAPSRKMVRPRRG